MAIKPHLKLNTKKQADKPEVLKFNYGFGKEEDNAQEQPNYFPMARSFRYYLTNFNSDLNNRIAERSKVIEVPDHIDYIRILFQSQFDLTSYFESWFKEFGLLGVNFSKFNHEILFAVIDRDLFKIFIQNIESFILKETGQADDAEYSGKIKYIKEFKLLSTADILQYRHHGALMNALLTNFPLDEKAEKEIRESLFAFLEKNGIKYRLLEETNHLELYDTTNQEIIEIAQNFDIVLSITSSLATVIKPSEFNLPERTYGFEIENSGDDLPIIGIIDTGISNQTPLAPIIINDNSFNITGSSSFEDNANGGSGHGTGVAALAALGRSAYHKSYKGKLKANAKLLSIKILDKDSGFLSEKDVLDLMRNAKAKYPEIKIFVLTTCYQANKGDNEDFSTYSYELDKFSYENDCLVFISTANNDDAAYNNSRYDLNYFFTEATNLCTPAESMNNIVVGAAADSLRNGPFEGISTSKEFPTLFTRKSHINLAALFPKNKINKSYFKPDIIECGGDYEQSGKFIGVGSKATMELLSAKNTESFYTQAGTSYSAPLAANIAAQIQKIYPSLTSQSIKALIINGASLNLIRFPKQFTSLLSKVAGHGFIEPQRSITSNDNSITLLIEDEITPEEVKIFPLNFPNYLTKTDFGKERGIIKITATLCFNFHPIMNHQLAYCPIHMAFRFAKNQSGAEILDSEKEIKSNLKAGLSWTQSARHKQKPMPYTNTQKISFPINVGELISEKNTFKLAVNCRINPQLLAGMENRYKTAHQFSIAITIEENLKDEKLTGQLYSEMENVNILENIAVIELEGEAIAEA
jgi:hypothetical protein